MLKSFKTDLKMSEHDNALGSRFLRRKKQYSQLPGLDRGKITFL